jgi:hypothetical protein
LGDGGGDVAVELVARNIFVVDSADVAEIRLRDGAAARVIVGDGPRKGGVVVDDDEDVVGILGGSEKRQQRENKNDLKH